MVIIQIVMLGKTSGQKPLHRPNYGVIMEPVMALNPIKEQWSHMVKIELPVVPDLPTGQPVLSHCKPANSAGMNCAALKQIIDNLVELRNNTAAMITNTASTIKDLIPDTLVPTYMSRTKRSLLPFLGDLASSLIGTATEADVTNLAEHIMVLQNRTEKSGKLFAEHTKRMTSFMISTDDRINNAIHAIKNNHDYIHTVADTVVDEVHHTVELLTRAMKALTGYVKYSNLIQFQLERLETGINEAIQGHLSSNILPPDTCRHILHHITNRLSVNFPDLQLASTNIEHLYRIMDVLLTRHGNTIYMVLKFPLQSLLLSHATVYEIITVPMPIPNNPTTVTQLINVPSYIAVTDNNRFYALLEPKDLTTCFGGKLKLCDNPLPFKSTSEESCALALIHGVTSKIKEMCNFTFTLSPPRPYILKLSTGQVIVSDKSDISMQCNTGGQILSGCQHCIYDVPCSCSIRTKTSYIPPSVMNCKNTMSDSAPLHTVNLAVLQEFFDDSTLSNISAHITYHQPLEVQIPEIKVFQQQFSDIMSSDKEQHLNLKTVIQATRNQQWAYNSLAEPFISNKLLPTNSVINYTAIISYFGLALSLSLTVGIIYLLFRTNKLTATVIALTQCQKSTTATVPPQLIYTLPTMTPDNTFTNTWYIFYQDHFTQLIIAIIGIVVVLVYIGHKFRKNSHATMMSLELTNGPDCVVIPLQPLPFCPEHWQFTSSDSISDITVDGYIKPKVRLNWHDLTVTNTFTGQTLRPPLEVTISHWMAYNIRKIISGPHNMYLFLIHHGYAFHLDHVGNQPSTSSIHRETNEFIETNETITGNACDDAIHD